MKRREFTRMATAGFLSMGFSPTLSTGSHLETTRENKRSQTIHIGTRLELFIDRLIIDTLNNVEFRLHEPKPLPLSDNPLPGIYTTVIKDDNIYRGYYRDYRPDYEGERRDGNPGEITCYAESHNGHDWTFPDLGIINLEGTHGKNIILAEPPFCHNFSPFIDTKPGIDENERYKALSGSRDDVFERTTGKPAGGLYLFVSPDGIHWQKKYNTPVIPYRKTSPAGETRFDSQNVAFWSEAEQLYICYFRTFSTPYGQLRTISRTTSPDFLNWSDPIPMNPNLPGEHLYTSNTHPYFRAPHIYIALPTRFFPQRGSSTDILFMATRAGSNRYERLFTEAFIRPGLDPTRWDNRSNYVALNVIPTSPTEMSIYHKDGHRYILRTDGFISVRAGAGKGEFLTHPLTFTGNTLIVNYSTSAAGSMQVELQTVEGTPLKGFQLEDCAPIIGDEIERTIHWKEDPKLEELAEKPVRLRFVMTECDVYSFGFQRMF